MISLSVLLREKPARIITTLKDSNNPWYLSKIAKATDTTYVYVTRFISTLERNGMVTIEKIGKKRVVKLTEKGLELANIIEELKRRLEGWR